MKYKAHQDELNSITDKSLHAALANLTDVDLNRICVALHNNEDDANAVAEGMIEQIKSEKRNA